MHYLRIRAINPQSRRLEHGSQPEATKQILADSRRRRLDTNVGLPVVGDGEIGESIPLF